MINLYLAVLNEGRLRRELSQGVIPLIHTTPGVAVHFEDMAVTYAEPIFSNRNKVVTRFLNHKPKQDFLMMIDEDVVPQQNPAELIFADKDIISVATPVRQVGRSINWNAYVKNPDLPGYAPCDFSAVSSDFELLKCDAVGTGCILIKRHVLEHLVEHAEYGFDAPFTILIDENGYNRMGTDLAFSGRARAAGFEINTTTQRWAEHYKEVGLLDITGFDLSDYRDSSPGKYGLHWGEWAIQQRDWEFLKDQIKKHKVKTILEFGSGLSSLLLSEVAEVTSYEVHPEWKTELEKRKGKNRLTVRLWDGQQVKERLGKYDLIFVDGPVGKVNGGPGREAAMRIAAEHSDRIIVHDAGRGEEWNFQRKYLRPDFEMVARNGNHQQRCQLWLRKKKSEKAK